jgi:hypothetical protein
MSRGTSFYPSHGGNVTPHREEVAVTLPPAMFEFLKITEVVP